MAIPIRDNTTALESLKTKAQNLPDRESGSSSGSGGVDTSDATVQSADVLYGKVFYGADGKSTGTMTDNSGWVQEISINGTYRLPNGYHKGSEVRVAVPSSGSSGVDTSDATAVSADVRDGVTFYNADGKQTGSMPEADIGDGYIYYDTGDVAKINATVSTAGYIGEGLISVGHMPVLKIGTIVPDRYGTSFITEGKYIPDRFHVSGDSNLVAENIKSGVSIFGVTGSYEGSLKYDATVKYDSVVDTLSFSNIPAFLCSKYINCSKRDADNIIADSLENDTAWVSEMFVSTDTSISWSIYVVGKYKHSGELHDFHYVSNPSSTNNGMQGDVNLDFGNINNTTVKWDESYYGQINFWHSYTDSEGNPSSINLTLPLRFLGTYGIKNLNFSS